MFRFLQRFFTPRPAVDPRVVPVEKHRAALELIDERIGRPDHRVTDQDLGAARDILEGRRSGRRFDPVELGFLREQLPALPAYLRPPEKRAPVWRPFAVALEIAAIPDPKTRAVAHAIDRHFGNASGELRHVELEGARRWLAGAAGRPAGLGDGELDPAQVDRISLFMEHGKGGLFWSKPVSIRGRVFSDSFALPDELGKRTEAEIEALLDKYEQRFDSSNYDRIYIRGDDGRLYVAVNAKGAIDEVQPGARVLFDEGQLEKHGGIVLRVVDVPNSMREATIGFWRKVLRKATQELRGAFVKRIENPLAKTAGTFGPQELLIGAGIAGSVGAAAMFSATGALMVAGGIGGLVTGMNVLDYLGAKRDLGPFYQAVGVTLNKSDRILY